MHAGTAPAVADVALSEVPGSRVPMRMLSRADDAMGWLPLAATGSSEAIGAVSQSRSPCRRPRWGSQVGGLHSSHARRFRRRWCNWGHNAQVPGPCGGPRKRARVDRAPHATRFKLWRGGAGARPPPLLNWAQLAGCSHPREPVSPLPAVPNAKVAGGALRHPTRQNLKRVASSVPPPRARLRGPPTRPRHWRIVPPVAPSPPEPPRVTGA